MKKLGPWEARSALPGTWRGWSKLWKLLRIFLSFLQNWKCRRQRESLRLSPYIILHSSLEELLTVPCSPGSLQRRKRRKVPIVLFLLLLFHAPFNSLMSYSSHSEHQKKTVLRSTNHIERTQLQKEGFETSGVFSVTHRGILSNGGVVSKTSAGFSERRILPSTSQSP